MGPTAQTSQIDEGQYKQGTPGVFEFSSFELGTGSFMHFPPPMGMEFTVSELVIITLTFFWSHNVIEY